MSPMLRYDGLYALPDESYTQYLRFRPTGVCHAVSSTGTPADVARWLGGPDETFVCQGPFTLAENRLFIRTDSSAGRVEYHGTVSAARDELALHTHSHINGYKSYGVWRFYPVTFPS